MASIPYTRFMLATLGDYGSTTVVSTGTDVGGNLVGELVFTAIASTASIQMEIISSSGGTTFTITDFTIVKNP